MCIRRFYGTYYCQRLYINCLAIACKLNTNLLIVRQIGDTCSPLSSWSSWSSSEDWDKCLIPSNENSHILSAWATFSYGLGSSKMLLAESSNLYCSSCVNNVESWYQLLVSIFSAVASNPAWNRSSCSCKSKIPTRSPHRVCSDCTVAGSSNR